MNADQGFRSRQKGRREEGPRLLKRDIRFADRKWLGIYFPPSPTPHLPVALLPMDGRSSWLMADNRYSSTTVIPIPMATNSRTMGETSGSERGSVPVTNDLQSITDGLRSIRIQEEVAQHYASNADAWPSETAAEDSDDEDDWSREASPRQDGPIDISGWTVTEPVLSASDIAAAAATPLPEPSSDEEGDVSAEAAAVPLPPSPPSVGDYLLAATIPLPASPTSLEGVMTPEGTVVPTDPNANDLPAPEPLTWDPEVDSFLALLEQEMDQIGWPRDDEVQGDAPPTAAAEALASSNVASVVAGGDAPTDDTPRDALAMTEIAMGGFAGPADFVLPTDEWPAMDADGDALMAETYDNDEAPTDEWAHNDSEGDAPMADAADAEVQMDGGDEDVVMGDAEGPADVDDAVDGLVEVQDTLDVVMYDVAVEHELVPTPMTADRLETSHQPPSVLADTTGRAGSIVRASDNEPLPSRESKRLRAPVEAGGEDDNATPRTGTFSPRRTTTMTRRRAKRAATPRAAIDALLPSPVSSEAVFPCFLGALSPASTLDGSESPSSSGLAGPLATPSVPSGWAVETDIAMRPTTMVWGRSSAGRPSGLERSGSGSSTTTEDDASWLQRTPDGLRAGPMGAGLKEDDRTPTTLPPRRPRSVHVFAREPARESRWKSSFEGMRKIVVAAGRGLVRAGAKRQRDPLDDGSSEGSAPPARRLRQELIDRIPGADPRVEESPSTASPGKRNIDQVERTEEEEASVDGPEVSIPLSHLLLIRFNPRHPHHPLRHPHHPLRHLHPRHPLHPLLSPSV